MTIKASKTDSLMSGEVKAWFIVYVLQEKFQGKKCRTSGLLFCFFNHLYGYPKANFGPLHWQGDSPTNSVLIAVLYLIWPKGHRKGHNEVGSQSWADLWDVKLKC